MVGGAPTLSKYAACAASVFSRSAASWKPCCTSMPVKLTARSMLPVLAAFCAWGNSWDKRVAWEAWVAWTRILRQSAQKGTWPARLDKLNNLALRDGG